jgi:hypothetical protein
MIQRDWEHIRNVQMKSNGLFQIVGSGDGYQITNSAGEIIAWTMELAWAALIAKGLEQQVSEVAADNASTLADKPVSS